MQTWARTRFAALSLKGQIHVWAWEQRAGEAHWTFALYCFPAVWSSSGYMLTARAAQCPQACRRTQLLEHIVPTSGWLLIHLVHSSKYSLE